MDGDEKTGVAVGETVRPRLVCACRNGGVSETWRDVLEGAGEVDCG